MNAATHLSSEELDLLELGTLGPDETARADAHLASCSGCAQRQQTLRADTAHFRQYVQPRTSAAMAQVGIRRRRNFAWPVLGALAAAALVLMFVTRVGEGEREAPYVAVRGEPTLSIVVARGEAQTELRPGAPLRPGDRLRFRVDGAGASHVLVLSRDPAGSWSVYAPFDGTESIRLDAGEQVLPGAVELDATRGQEHLVAVFSDLPLSASTLVAHLRDRALGPSTTTLQDVPGARAVRVIPFEKR